MKVIFRVKPLEINEFKILVTSLKPLIGGEKKGSNERTVEKVLNMCLKFGQFSYSDSTYKTFYYKGLNSSMVQKFENNFAEEKFKKFINEASDEQKESIANFLNNELKPESDIGINNVSYFCVNLMSKLIEKAKYKKGSNQKESSSRNEKQKFDVRSGAHQFIEYENDKGVIDVDGEIYPVSSHLQGESLEKTEKLPYSNVLFEIYSEKLNDTINADNIDTSDFANDYRRQQEFFNEAAWYERSLRDTVLDFDKQYELLKQDIYDGIEPVYSDEDFGTDGYKRLKNVHKQVVVIQLDRSNLKNIDNMLGNNTKKGLCHVLVNDNRIKSWVNVDYDEII